MSDCQAGIRAYNPLNNYLNKSRGKVNGKVKGTQAIDYLAPVSYSEIYYLVSSLFLQIRVKQDFEFFEHGGSTLYPNYQS